MWSRDDKPDNGRQATITPIPVTYRGIHFASTLEADWAATFDTLNWYWEYEPIGLHLGGSICYRPDFRLPGQRVWVEVKGPHDQRIDKPRRMHHLIGDVDRPLHELIIIARPAGPGNTANWHCGTGDHRLRISRCGACQQWCFNRPLADQWRCRHCNCNALIPEASYVSATQARGINNEFAEYDHNIDWIAVWFGEHGRLPMARAPRNGRRT